MRISSLPRTRQTAVAPERPRIAPTRPVVVQRAWPGQRDPGPQHPEDSELAQIRDMRGDKDDWLWAYPDDPTRPDDNQLLTIDELLERRA